MTVSSAVVALAEQDFTFATDNLGEPVAIPLTGPNVAYPLRGRGGLRALLADAYAVEEGTAPSAQGLADALLVLEGRGRRGPRVAPALRVSRVPDVVVLDLGHDDGQAVVVTPGGWQVVGRSPVLFRRTALTAPLPTPTPGGDLNELVELLNVEPATWPLLRGWLVAALLPDVPQPIGLLQGPQGSGKSATARMLAQLLDPSPAPLRTAPGALDDWAVAASGSLVVAVDNISTISEWFSDALCRAATGDGLVRRRLYSDSDVSVLSFRRVMLLTSIDPGALRGDLADRLLLVELRPIAPGRRRLDADLADRFEAARPRLLGGLLDLLAQVLVVLPEVHPPELPRMADFARVLAAVDTVLGTTSFIDYTRMGTDLVHQVVEDDPVGRAVVGLAERDVRWCGTAGDLLSALTPDPSPHGWPKNPRSMSSAIRRLAPALGHLGVQLDYTRENGTNRRLWTITTAERAAGRPSQPPQPSRAASDLQLRGDGPRDGRPVIAPSSVTDNTLSDLGRCPGCGGCDDCDGPGPLPSPKAPTVLLGTELEGRPSC